MFSINALLNVDVVSMFSIDTTLDVNVASMFFIDVFDHLKLIHHLGLVQIRTHINDILGYFSEPEPTSKL